VKPGKVEVNSNNVNTSTLSEKSSSTFEQALSLIYEDTLVDWVKMIFIDLSSQNMIIPWIYLFYNEEFSYDMRTLQEKNASQSSMAKKQT